MQADPEQHEDFFRRKGEHHIRLWNYEPSEGISLEELYQLFKARLLAELNGDSDHHSSGE